MIRLYKPALEDLWFRRRMLADPETMSYNRAWGGTIPFPRKDWAAWYDRWIAHPEGKRYYRYAADASNGTFVGEIAYHFDDDRQIWLADIIICSAYRGRGYGREGLTLLCEAAAERGIAFLYDDLAIDNPALSLFQKNGFTEEYRTEDKIFLRRDLRNNGALPSPGTGDGPENTVR